MMQLFSDKIGNPCSANHKMVKHIQQVKTSCLNMSDHFLGLELKRLIAFSYKLFFAESSIINDGLSDIYSFDMFQVKEVTNKNNKLTC